MTHASSTETQKHSELALSSTHGQLVTDPMSRGVPTLRLPLHIIQQRFIGLIVRISFPVSFLLKTPAPPESYHTRSHDVDTSLLPGTPHSPRRTACKHHSRGRE